MCGVHGHAYFMPPSPIDVCVGVLLWLFVYAFRTTWACLMGCETAGLHAVACGSNSCTKHEGDYCIVCPCLSCLFNKQLLQGNPWTPAWRKHLFKRHPQVGSLVTMCLAIVR